MTETNSIPDVIQSKLLRTFKLNIDNIHTLDDVKNILHLIGPMFTFCDEDPRADLLKKYFDIPYAGSYFGKQND